VGFGLAKTGEDIKEIQQIKYGAAPGEPGGPKIIVATGSVDDYVHG
jgi:hypothetical protein